MKLKNLIEQKHEAVRQMREAAHNAKSENRAMSQEELQRFNAADADLQKIQSSIEAEEKLNALELDLQERAELAPKQELSTDQKRNLAFEKYIKELAKLNARIEMHRLFRIIEIFMNFYSNLMSSKNLDLKIAIAMITL